MEFDEGKKTGELMELVPQKWDLIFARRKAAKAQWEIAESVLKDFAKFLAEGEHPRMAIRRAQADVGPMNTATTGKIITILVSRGWTPMRVDHKATSRHGRVAVSGHSVKLEDLEEFDRIGDE